MVSEMLPREGIDSAVTRLQNLGNELQKDSPKGAQNVDRQLFQLGKLMQSLAVHCRRLAEVKVSQKKSCKQNVLLPDDGATAEVCTKRVSNLVLQSTSEGGEGSMLSLVKDEHISQRMTKSSCGKIPSRLKPSEPSDWSIAPNNHFVGTPNTRRRKNETHHYPGSDSSLDFLGKPAPRIRSRPHAKYDVAVDRLRSAGNSQSSGLSSTATSATDELTKSSLVNRAFKKHKRNSLALRREDEKYQRPPIDQNLRFFSQSPVTKCSQRFTPKLVPAKEVRVHILLHNHQSRAQLKEAADVAVIDLFQTPSAIAIYRLGRLELLSSE
ncbi:hypothetical protein Ciccas_012628 [Cichlidogyrus casuarinus]|uniref:Uncharacterized protein n=1 Tax=Cichlidogyrus casuarinus TaxID=1844966 RepID=A0ABD2PMX2_9PLAT